MDEQTDALVRCIISAVNRCKRCKPYLGCLKCEDSVKLVEAVSGRSFMRWNGGWMETELKERMERGEW